MGVFGGVCFKVVRTVCPDLVLRLNLLLELKEARNGPSWLHVFLEASHSSSSFRSSMDLTIVPSFWLPSAEKATSNLLLLVASASSLGPHREHCGADELGQHRAAVACCEGWKPMMLVLDEHDRPVLQ